eukprot:jgi/Chrzof1/2662/Cz11g24100.t1
MPNTDMSDSDLQMEDRYLEEEDLGQPTDSNVENGYTTGATTGSDEEVSDFFGEDLDPMSLIGDLELQQPGDSGMQPYEVVRRCRTRKKQPARAKKRQVCQLKDLPYGMWDMTRTAIAYSMPDGARNRHGSNVVGIFRKPWSPVPRNHKIW